MADSDETKTDRRRLDGMLENVIKKTEFVSSEKTDEELAQMESVSEDELSRMMATLDTIVPEGKRTGAEMQLQTPEVDITIDGDRMRAILAIRIPKGPVKRVDKDAVVAAMTSAGIVHGLKTEEIVALIAEAERKYFAEGCVATGTPPERGIDGEIVWLIPKPGDVLNRDEKFPEGKIIAKRVPARPGVPGTDIYGKEVSAEMGTEADFPFDRGVKFDARVMSFLTEIEGHIYFKEGRVTVEPVKITHDANFWVDIVDDGGAAEISITPGDQDGRIITLDEILKYLKENEIGGYDEKLLTEFVEKAAAGEEVISQRFASSGAARVEVIIGEDGSHAKLRIVSPENPVKRLTPERIRDMAIARIKESGITVGFNEKKLSEILKKASKRPEFEDLIAEGVPVQDGENAELRWLVEKPAEGGAPVVIPMGKMLVKLKPPTTGKPGMTVTGQEIPPTPGAEVNLTRGRGVMFDRKNLCWYAKEQGRLSHRGQLLEILPHRDADFGIEIHESGLSASLTIRPAKGEGKKVSLEDVLAEIAKQQIRRYEIDLVKDMVTKAAEGIEISGGVIATGEPAYIETTLNATAMEARIKVELPGDPIRDLPDVYLKKEIASALEAAGIVHGIDQTAIDQVVAAACGGGSAESAVAKGTPPKDGTDGQVEWVVEDPTGENAVIIAPGKVIAKALPPGRGVPGTTVTGYEIPPRAGLEPHMTIGRGVNFDRRRQVWFSAEAITGRVIVVEKRLSIVPHTDSYFTVDVNPTGTQAFLTIVPGKGKGMKITFDAVVDEIKKQDIAGWNEADVRKAVESAAQGVNIANKLIAESQPPEIRAAVSEDKLEARLSIRLAENPVRKPEVEIIEQLVKTALDSALVVKGIDEKKIEAAIAGAVRSHQADDVVALGIPPEDGTDAELEWMVEKPEEGKVVLVAAGKLLARLKEGGKGKPGQTVTGETLTPKPGRVPSITLGPGIVHDRRRGSWAAKLGGRLFFKDDRLHIASHEDAFFEIQVDPAGLSAQISAVPGKGDGKKISMEDVTAEVAKQGIVNYDEQALVSVVSGAANGAAATGVVFARSEPPFISTAIAADAMEATATIEMGENPVKPMPVELLVTTIESALKSAGVLTGIESAAIKEFADKALLEGKNEGVIARGKLPEDGVAGTVEWAVEQPVEGKEVIVAAGNMLAKATNATRGNPGETVTGIPLPAKPGAEARLQYGKGVKFDGSRRSWWSTNSGKLAMTGGRLQVFSHAEGSFEVFFDASGLQALLSINPPQGDAKAVTLEDILAEIADKGIVNFDRSVVETSVGRASSGVSVMNAVIGSSEPPELDAIISADRMEARLRISMPSAPLRAIEPPAVISLAGEKLAQKGVKFGIDNVKLTAIVTKAIAEGQAEDVVAAGTAAENGADGVIEWKVPNPEGTEEVLVAAGKIIAIATSPDGGTGGQNVLGEMIPSKAGRDPHMTIAQGVLYVPAKRHWVAEVGGKLFFKDHTVFIAGHGDGSFSVYVDKDGMNARLTIIPPKGEGKPVVIDEILAGIEKKGVVVFDRSMVEQALERVALGETVDEIVIGQGSDPRPGKDGYLEYLVEQPKAKRGMPSLIAISQGQVFAAIYPAQQGEPGRNVFGKEVAAPPVKEAELEVGEGVEVEDAVYAEGKSGKKALIGGRIKAAIDGNLLVRGNVVEVRKILKFDHDLTAAMGNVDFDGHVVVEGCVNDNVQVKTAGDIYVQNGVAAALLDAGGNIEIGGGIAGRDRGVINARGSVIVQFVERAKVMAGKDILVANAVLHSQLYAREEIEITQGKGMFIGGKATAGTSIRARTIGSGTGTPTSVNVGIDPFVELEVIELDKKLIALRNAVRELQPAIEEITALLQEQKSAVLLLKFRELTRRKVMIPVEMKEHLKRRGEIFLRLYPEVDAFIEAYDQLHLGVNVMVGKEQLFLQAPVVLAKIKTGANGVYSVPIRDADLGKTKLTKSEKGVDMQKLADK